MVHASSEMQWARWLLYELSFPVQENMPIHCNIQADILIANKINLYKYTKHIEIDFHIKHNTVLTNLITTPRVGTSYQLVDILSKRLSITSYDSISHKLGLLIYML